MADGPFEEIQKKLEVDLAGCDKTQDEARAKLGNPMSWRDLIVWVPVVGTKLADAHWEEHRGKEAAINKRWNQCSADAIERAGNADVKEAQRQTDSQTKAIIEQVRRELGLNIQPPDRMPPPNSSSLSRTK